MPSFSFTAPLLLSENAASVMFVAERRAGFPTLLNACDTIENAQRATPRQKTTGADFSEEVVGRSQSPLLSLSSARKHSSPTQRQRASQRARRLTPKRAFFCGGRTSEAAEFAVEEEGAGNAVSDESSLKPNLGLGLMMANVGTFALSLQYLCVKIAAADGPPSVQSLLVRFGIHASAVLVCCGLSSFGYHGRFWDFEIWRAASLTAALGFCTMIAMALAYYANSHWRWQLCSVIPYPFGVSYGKSCVHAKAIRVQMVPSVSYL